MTMETLLTMSAQTGTGTGFGDARLSTPVVGSSIDGPSRDLTGECDSPTHLGIKFDSLAQFTPASDLLGDFCFRADSMGKSEPSVPIDTPAFSFLNYNRSNEQGVSVLAENKESSVVTTDSNLAENKESSVVRTDSNLAENKESSVVRTDSNTTASEDNADFGTLPLSSFQEEVAVKSSADLDPGIHGREYFEDLKEPFEDHQRLPQNLKHSPRNLKCSPQLTSDFGDLRVATSELDESKKVVVEFTEQQIKSFNDYLNLQKLLLSRMRGKMPAEEDFPLLEEFDALKEQVRSFPGHANDFPDWEGLDPCGKDVSEIVQLPSYVVSSKIDSSVKNGAATQRNRAATQGNGAATQGNGAATQRNRATTSYWQRPGIDDQYLFVEDNNTNVPTISIVRSSEVRLAAERACLKDLREDLKDLAYPIRTALLGLGLLRTQDLFGEITSSEYEEKVKTYFDAIEKCILRIEYVSVQKRELCNKIISAEQILNLKDHFCFCRDECNDMLKKDDVSKRIYFSEYLFSRELSYFETAYNQFRDNLMLCNPKSLRAELDRNLVFPDLREKYIDGKICKTYKMSVNVKRQSSDLLVPKTQQKELDVLDGNHREVVSQSLVRLDDDSPRNTATIQDPQSLDVADQDVALPMSDGFQVTPAEATGSLEVLGRGLEKAISSVSRTISDFFLSFYKGRNITVRDFREEMRNYFKLIHESFSELESFYNQNKSSLQGILEQNTFLDLKTAYEQFSSLSSFNEASQLYVDPLQSELDDASSTFRSLPAFERKLKRVQYETTRQNEPRFTKHPWNADLAARELKNAIGSISQSISDVYYVLRTSLLSSFNEALYVDSLQSELDDASSMFRSLRAFEKKLQRVQDAKPRQNEPRLKEDPWNADLARKLENAIGSISQPISDIFYVLHTEKNLTGRDLFEKSLDYFNTIDGSFAVLDFFHSQNKSFFQGIISEAEFCNLKIAFNQFWSKYALAQNEFWEGFGSPQEELDLFSDLLGSLRFFREKFLYLQELFLWKCLAKSHVKIKNFGEKTDKSARPSSLHDTKLDQLVPKTQGKAVSLSDEEHREAVQNVLSKLVDHDSQIKLQDLSVLDDPRCDLQNVGLQLRTLYSSEKFYEKCWQKFSLLCRENSYENIAIFCYYADLLDSFQAAKPQYFNDTLDYWPDDTKDPDPRVWAMTHLIALKNCVKKTLDQAESSSVYRNALQSMLSRGFGEVSSTTQWMTQDLYSIPVERLQSAFGGRIPSFGSYAIELTRELAYSCIDNMGKLLEENKQISAYYHESWGSEGYFPETDENRIPLSNNRVEEHVLTLDALIEVFVKEPACQGATVAFFLDCRYEMQCMRYRCSTSDFSHLILPLSLNGGYSFVCLEEKVLPRMSWLCDRLDLALSFFADTKKTWCVESLKVHVSKMISKLDFLAISSRQIRANGQFDDSFAYTKPGQRHPEPTSYTIEGNTAVAADLKEFNRALEDLNNVKGMLHYCYSFLDHVSVKKEAPLFSGFAYFLETITAFLKYLFLGYQGDWHYTVNDYIEASIALVKESLRDFEPFMLSKQSDIEKAEQIENEQEREKELRKALYTQRGMLTILQDSPQAWSRAIEAKMRERREIKMNQYK